VFPHRFGDALGREILFTAWEYKGRELGARGIAMPVLTQAEVLPFALAAAHRFCASASREQLVEMKSRLAAPLRDELPVVLERELDMHQRTFVGNARVLERIKEAFQAEPEVATPVKVQSPPAAELRSALVATLAEELMIPAAEIRDGSGFLELGLDSILAVTWIRRINALFGVELPATAVYAHPTVGALVQHVAQLQPSVETPVAPAAAPPPPVRRSAIAIIGASARFPQAADLAEFWRNIRDGRDCISEVPGDRWNIQEHYDPDPQAPDMSYSKWMGSIDGIDRFDAAFFNITAMEAELMDPQQRLFLQHAWHAIEDAGINPTKLAGSQCGIFTAAGDSGYSELISDRNAYSLIGRSGSILAARLAYHLDLRGPSLSIDTACSSSLVAVAQACSSLLAGDTDLAIAGGVSVLL
jgi:acyl carrier protein